MADEPGPDALTDALAEHASYLAVERGLRPNTLAAYRRDLRAYERFLRRRAVTGPGDVTPTMVAAYATALRARRDESGHARLAAASVARALVAVRSFHRFCLDEGLGAGDPTADMASPRVPAGIPKPLSEPEVEALLAAAGDDGPAGLRDRALLEVLYGAGVRISELVGLDRADLELERGLLRVLGKGGKERIVPLGRPARGAVAAYLERGRPVLVRPGGGRARAGDAVFLNARGGRLTRQGVWGLVRAAGHRAGLGDRVYPHVLRHSCATHMVDRGADIRVVQELLGHASLSTTQVYTQVSAARLRAVYDAAHPRARAHSSGDRVGGRR
ncbi:MAG TPA: site-specific tyrosine recombinase [Acidimicrobiia bacterium]|nr:site-specific tyrosine recombinase [Acidimicrobiia bacterium]